MSPYCLFEDRLAPGGKAWLFDDPVDILTCTRATDVPRTLQMLEQARRDGYYAAGYLAYELGAALEPKLAPLCAQSGDRPLLWLGLFKAPKPLSGQGADAYLAKHTASGYRMSTPRPALAREPYTDRIHRIKDYIAAGDVYQINFTFPLHFEITGDPVALYASLRERQKVAYGALIRTGTEWLLSLSPELFVSCTDGVLEARPMKGTVRRSPDAKDDAALAAWLRQDPKNRAENLMIVDLLRNDLSRIAESGSVRVPELFTVESYPSFHTMTSRITARAKPGAGIGEILTALFPCGSITGAPKIRAMEIIDDLEGAPRGPYTGAIGMIAPSGDFRFNVAIRTAHIRDKGAGVLGIGGGIVWDSDPRAEYNECLLKARFLLDACDPRAHTSLH